MANIKLTLLNMLYDSKNEHVPLSYTSLINTIKQSGLTCSITVVNPNIFNVNHEEQLDPGYGYTQIILRTKSLCFKYIVQNINRNEVVVVYASTDHNVGRR